MVDVGTIAVLLLQAFSNRDDIIIFPNHDDDICMIESIVDVLNDFGLHTNVVIVDDEIDIYNIVKPGTLVMSFRECKYKDFINNVGGFYIDMMSYDSEYDINFNANIWMDTYNEIRV